MNFLFEFIFGKNEKKKHPSNNLQKQFFENEKLVTPTRNFSMPDREHISPPNIFVF